MSDDLLRRAELLGTILATKDQDASAGVVAELMARIEADAATIARLTVERDALTTAGIIEVAVRNPSVFDYMRHWEGRTEAAEAQVAALVAHLEAVLAIAERNERGIATDAARAAIAAAKEGAA